METKRCLLYTSPMGIADMDIATPDFVIDGIRKRLDHPMLGYFRPDERFFQAILGWQKEQYGTADLSREDVAVQTSVLGGVASAVKAFTEPGDGVLVQAPGYFNFAQVINGLGRRLVTTRPVSYTHLSERAGRCRGAGRPW